MTYWDVLLPVLLTEPGLPAPPANVPRLEWLLDTGNRGEAFAWRWHLLDGGLDPDVQRLPVNVRVTSVLGHQQVVPLRAADLWLLSNLPAFHGQPYRMSFSRGLAFKDVPTLPDPKRNRPLIGVRLLRQAKLKVELDFTNDTVSVWTP